MSRERWFYARDNRGRGPAALSQVVESVLGQPDPKAVLVWRKGFADWTRAEDVPEVERRIAPFLARKAAEEAARRPPAPPPVVAPPPPPRVVEEAKPGSAALVYGGIAAGVAVLALLGWLFWPRPQPAEPVPIGGTTVENAPAVVIPAPPAGTPSAVPTATPTPTPTPTPRPTPTAPVVTAMSDRETDLPKSEIRKLRPVWAWEAETLKGTVYNGTGWRVTELYVRVGRFLNEDFVEDPRPIVLSAPGGEVDAGVADLLSKVAPDRKRPGINPLDTGVFQGRAGARPENFRAEIESARGYAPK
jgi:GYF domain 2